MPSNTESLFSVFLRVLSVKAFSAGSVALIAGCFPSVRHPPDAIRRVVGENQRPIAGHSNAHRTPPNIRIVHNESRNEIFILARGLPVRRKNTHDFISRAVSAVPGAVGSYEQIAAIFSGELLPFVKRQGQRSGMGLQQYIGN